LPRGQGQLAKTLGRWSTIIVRWPDSLAGQGAAGSGRAGDGQGGAGGSTTAGNARPALFGNSRSNFPRPARAGQWEKGQSAEREWVKPAAIFYRPSPSLSPRRELRVGRSLFGGLENNFFRQRQTSLQLVGDRGRHDCAAGTEGKNLMIPCAWIRLKVLDQEEIAATAPVAGREVNPCAAGRGSILAALGPSNWARFSSLDRDVFQTTGEPSARHDLSLKTVSSCRGYANFNNLVRGTWPNAKLQVFMACPDKHFFFI